MEETASLPWEGWRREAVSNMVPHVFSYCTHIHTYTHTHTHRHTHARTHARTHTHTHTHTSTHIHTTSTHTHTHTHTHTTSTHTHISCTHISCTHISCTYIIYVHYVSALVWTSLGHQHRTCDSNQHSDNSCWCVCHQAVIQDSYMLAKWSLHILTPTTMPSSTVPRR